MVHRQRIPRGSFMNDIWSAFRGPNHGNEVTTLMNSFNNNNNNNNNDNNDHNNINDNEQF